MTRLRRARQSRLLALIRVAVPMPVAMTMLVRHDHHRRVPVHHDRWRRLVDVAVAVRWLGPVHRRVVARRIVARWGVDHLRLIAGRRTRMTLSGAALEAPAKAPNTPPTTAPSRPPTACPSKAPAPAPTTVPSTMSLAWAAGGNASASTQAVKTIRDPGFMLLTPERRVG